MIIAAVEESFQSATDHLWEVALKETVSGCGFRSAPAVSLACDKLGIPLPETQRPFMAEGERFVGFGFVWPEDAVAFLGYFAATDFAARVSMPAEEILRRLAS